jgi:hypothetical protein
VIEVGLERGRCAKVVHRQSERPNVTNAASPYFQVEIDT